MMEPPTQPYESTPAMTNPCDSSPTASFQAVAVGISQRFTIERLHAKGGLGQVSVALDGQLRRRVALKEIRPDRRGDEARRRFLIEAEITGQLEHPGIVPIYALEKDAGGEPCYAMRFIQGQSLAEAIRRFHAGDERRGLSLPADGGDKPRRSSDYAGLEFRQLLQRFVSVCQTVAFAHSRGFIHRDLKPANIMLGDYGETLVVDWGLAKRMTAEGERMNSDSSANVSSDSSFSPQPSSLPETRPIPSDATKIGEALGTPAYMAPEQARGEWDVVGPAADIFSLGAILYELFTNCRALQGQDVMEVLSNAKAGHFAPPRKVKREVPKALEAICMKAMAAKPEERYCSAQALAEDVEHWLADEAVAAWQEPWTARCRRWLRRHRTSATAAVVFLAVALVLGAGGWWWAERARAARLVQTAGQVERALGQALELRAQARAAPVGELSKWREALAAAGRAEGALAAGEADAELAEQVADLVQQLQAEESARRGDAQMAARLERIRLQRAALRDGHFDDVGADAAYAAAFQEFGVDLGQLTVDAAAERLRQHTSILLPLALALDDWAEVRRDFVTPDRRWGHLLAIAAKLDVDPVRSRLRLALVMNDAETLENVSKAADAADLPAATLALLGQALGKDGRPDATEELLRRALWRRPDDFWLNYQLGFQLSQRNPAPWDEVLRFYSIARALRPDSPGAILNVGWALTNRGDSAEAIAAFEEALRIQPDYAEAHFNLGVAWEKKGEPVRAVKAYRQAIALQPRHAAAHSNLGAVLNEQGKREEAISAYRDALKADPNHVVAYYNLGVALKEKGQKVEAAAAFRDALRHDPGLSQAHHGLGVTLTEMGRPEEALPSLREAVRRRPDWAEAHSSLGRALRSVGELTRAANELNTAVRLKPDLATAHNELGLVLRDLGKLPAAVMELQEAARLNPKLAAAHSNLGVVLKELGRLDEAIPAYRKALELNPANAGAWSNLGAALKQKGRLAEAETAYQEAIRHDPSLPAAHLNLAMTLRLQGKLAEALAEFRRGDELGREDRRWALPSDQWVRDCERLVALEPRLAAVRRGDDKPADAEEQGYFAQLIILKGNYVTGARWYAEVFAARPALADDVKLAFRYDGAGAAARAGVGLGEDAPAGADERAHLRRQARDWLHADLALRKKQLAAPTLKDRKDVQKALGFWQTDGNLAGVRDAEALERLPADERDSWRRFWVEVADLLKQAEG